MTESYSPFKDGQIGDFNALQKRIGRKTVSQKLQQEGAHSIMLYDLLEWGGEDQRQLPLYQRQKLLRELYQKLPKELPLMLSEVLHFSSWDAVAQERDRAQEMRSEGLMLKHKDSPYAVGRKKEPGGNGNQTPKPSTLC